MNFCYNLKRMVTFKLIITFYEVKFCNLFLIRSYDADGGFLAGVMNKSKMFYRYLLIDTPFFLCKVIWVHVNIFSFIVSS